MKFELKEDVDRLIKLAREKRSLPLDGGLAAELNWSLGYLEKIARVAVMVSRRSGLALQLMGGRLETVP